MATELDATKYVPDISGSMHGIASIIASNSTSIVIGIFVLFILMLLYKLSTHRVQIERLTPVEGGYVSTTGRYRLVYDKKSKRPSFVSMFGNEKLPAYDSKYFQKIQGGIPFIGAMRTLSLVFINKYSPVVCNTNGQLEHIDNKRWLFDTDKAQYIKQRESGNLAYFLAIYAPLIVIVGSIAFWAVTIFMQINVVENFGDQLTELVKRLGG